MKLHMKQPDYSMDREPDSSYITWCNIDDTVGSEKLRDNLVTNWNDCTCANCRLSYQKFMRKYNEQETI